MLYFAVLAHQPVLYMSPDALYVSSEQHDDLPLGYRPLIVRGVSRRCVVCAAPRIRDRQGEKAGL